MRTLQTFYNNETDQMQLLPTPLRTNDNYVVYYNFVTKTLLTELFPYVTLIFLNFCIYREIRRSVKIRQSMRCTSQSQNEEIKSANIVVSPGFADKLSFAFLFLQELVALPPPPTKLVRSFLKMKTPLLWHFCDPSYQRALPLYQINYGRAFFTPHRKLTLVTPTLGKVKFIEYFPSKSSNEN